MKRISLLVIAAVTAAVLASQNRRPESILGAALHQEEVQGDLNSAIAAYQKLLATRGLSHKVAAEALYHLGLCYQKLGDAKARQAFERLVAEYGDQTAWVAQARAKLVAIGGTQQPARQKTTIVWSGQTVDPEGTISADGRYLTHPDWKTGNVAVHDFISGTDRVVTTDGSWKAKEAAFAEDTAISRDGKRVAYGWYQAKNNRFELRIANLVGEPNPRKIFESEEMRYLGPQDWSPDGKWVAVAMEPENSNARTNQPLRLGQRAAIALVNVEDGSFRVAKSTAWSGFDSGFGKVLFSPDGKYLAYDRPANTSNIQRDVFVTAIGSDQEVAVATSPAHEQLMGWSPDGRYVLFTSNRTGSTALWAVAFANGTTQGEAELIKPDIGRIVPVGLTATGALYYCVPTALDLPRIQVARFDMATGKLLSAPANLTDGGTAREEMPTWSPDGKRLAYVSRWLFVFGPRGAFYVGDQELSIKIRTIETGDVHEFRPSVRGWLNGLRWAPDGQSLVALGFPTPHGILRYDLQNGETSTLLKVQTPLENPTLSRDGKTAYDMRRPRGSNGGFRFVEVDLASGKDREILRAAKLGGLNLSPDERYIATASEDPSDRARIFLIIPVNGGAPREALRIAADTQGGVSLLAWAPDSRSVLIRKFLGGDRGAELWQAFVDGSESRKLDGRLDPRLTSGGIRLSPDGRWIALVPAAGPAQVKAPAQIVALENFLPTAKTPATPAR